MASFKRTSAWRGRDRPPATRACPSSAPTVLASSGIPSLDDILGGGIPLSCVLALLAPDPHSAYGELVQKYFLAQGISSGHKVYIVREDALSFVQECMWFPASRSNEPTPDEDAVQDGDEIKIAWRYEQMRRFETTVTSLSSEHFCDVFDLTCRIPKPVVDEACGAARLVPLDPCADDDVTSSLDRLMKRMNHVLAATPPTEAVRLCILALGSPEWGDCHPKDILRFLHRLRRLVRRYPHACAFVSLAPHLCTDRWGGFGWAQKIGWITDVTILMSGFGANAGLAALFSSHHGTVKIYKSPAPHSILPASDKRSTLRGMSSSTAASVGTGENNLAFKCTRKRLTFETLHLDVEGGVTERRTTPSWTGGSDVGPLHTYVKGNAAEPASVPVELEATSADTKSRSPESRVSQQDTESGASGGLLARAKKGKKKVVFRSDKDDPYDF